MNNNTNMINISKIIETLQSDKEFAWYDDDMWAIGYNDGLDVAINVIKAAFGDYISNQSNFQNGGKSTMATVNLSSPWCILYREISAMFQEDKGVKVVLDDSTYTISVYVEDATKAEAISRLLIQERYYGNICVKVRVVPANGEVSDLPDDLEEIYKAAFTGNPALSYTAHIDLPMLSKNIYIVFKNAVVQYFNDDLRDVNGYCSTLYQEIAKDVFASENTAQVCYCTDVPTNLGKPLGEWP